MKDRDAKEFGNIVNMLVGKACNRTLAVNSLKFRFSTHSDPKGRQYIWIDPPWSLFKGPRKITASIDYTESGFLEWSGLFSPLDKTKLVSWSTDEHGTTFRFAEDLRIVVPLDRKKRSKEDWYDHWYARDKTIEPGVVADGSGLSRAVRGTARAIPSRG